MRLVILDACRNNPLARIDAADGGEPERERGAGAGAGAGGNER